MPCTDGGVPYSSRPDDYDLVRAGLCAALSVIVSEKGNISSLDYKEAGISQKQLERWWRNHQDEDDARKMREARERQKDREKQAALDKLSAAERKLLGL